MSLRVPFIRATSNVPLRRKRPANKLFTPQGVYYQERIYTANDKTHTHTTEPPWRPFCWSALLHLLSYKEHAQTHVVVMERVIPKTSALASSKQIKKACLSVFETCFCRQQNNLFFFLFFFIFACCTYRCWLQPIHMSSINIVEGMVSCLSLLLGYRKVVP